MDNQELARTRKALEDVRRELSTSKEKTLAFLIDADILLPNGEPRRDDPQHS